MSDRLAVQYEVSRQLAQRCRDGDELGGPVPTVPRPKPNVVAFLARDDPEAVMLQFMQPAVAARDAIGKDRLTGRDEARRHATAPSRDRGTHQHRSNCAACGRSGVPATIGSNLFLPSLQAAGRTFGFLILNQSAALTRSRRCSHLFHGGRNPR